MGLQYMGEPIELGDKAGSIGESKENNPSVTVTMDKDEFAKVFIIRNEDSSFPVSDLEYLGIGESILVVGSNTLHVMAKVSQASG
jgi:hypothetical protein